MKISKEVKVGLLALISIIILYFGFNYLKGIAYFSSENTYHVVYENIGGLKVSNPVVLNGFSVGRVRKINILHDRNNKLLVELDVDESLRLRENSQAVLSSSALLGDKTIVLKPGNKGEVLEPGDTLEGRTEKGLQETIMQETKPIVAKLDSTFGQINNIINDSTARDIKGTIRNLNKSSQAFYKMVQENRKNIVSISKNANELSQSLSATVKDVRPLIKKLDRFADTLQQVKINKTVAKANKTLDNLYRITARIDSGKGSLGKLTKEEALYNNLNRATKNLDTLLQDLNKNPKKYVHFSIFGRKNKEDKEKK